MKGLPIMKRAATVFLTLCAALVAPPAFAQGEPAQAATPQRAPRDVRFIVVHKPGPAWLRDRSPFEQPGMQDHVAHYRQWQAQGRLTLGGPFLDGAAGGMMVPEPGLSEAEVQAFAQADPAVKSGVLTFEVRPWLIGMRR